MLISKMLKVTLVSISLLILAGCATQGGGAAVSDGTTAGAGSDANGATASGVNGMSNFGDRGAGTAANKALQIGNQSYYFDFDSNNVHESDQASIKVQADYLVAHPEAKVRLEGNTDNRGSREYNIALGNRRAQSVADALEADGVNKNQIVTVSYGAEKPAATGNDEDAWQQNRRVDLVYQTSIK